MAYSESQKRATKKYNEKAYDDIKIRVPKGRRDIMKAYAEQQGKSLNQWIVELIEADMKE